MNSAESSDEDSKSFEDDGEISVDYNESSQFKTASLSPSHYKRKANEDNGTSLKKKLKFTDSFQAESHCSTVVKRTRHGTVYQLKLLMLFLKRGLHKGYDFRLATEMTEAINFDDLVFHYKDEKEDGKTYQRFLQAKHSQGEDRKITPGDLKTERENDFSLQKYFHSYCEIKNDPYFSKDNLKDFIICTNIDFDYDKFRSGDITLKSIKEADSMLEMDATYEAKRFKIKVPNESETYETLRNTSDLHRLVNIFENHLVEKLRMTLHTEIFKLYHGPLAKEVLTIQKEEGKNKRYATLQENFVNGQQLSTEALEFRNALEMKLNQRKDITLNPGEKILQHFQNQSLRVSKNFGQTFNLVENPQIPHVQKFVNKIAVKIRKAKENIVTITRTGILKCNIDKLAGHVFVKTEEDEIKLNHTFFDDSRQLQGNLNKFRELLKRKLERQGVEFCKLKECQFKISNFQTCEEEQLDSKPTLPNDYIEDDEIEAFLAKLVFAVNQPNEKQLGKIIKKEMGKHSHFNLLDSTLITDSFQKEMLDWFKEKAKEKHNAFFTNKQGQKLFQSLEYKLSKLINIGISLTSSAELRKYDDVKFISKTEKLKDFLNLSNCNKNKILSIITSKDSLLSRIKFYQTFHSLAEEFEIFTKYDSYIFIHLDSLFDGKIRKHVLNAFKADLELLILDCTSVLKERKEDVNKLLEDLLGRLTNKDIKNKKLITIGEEGSDVYGCFLEAFRQITSSEVLYEKVEKDSVSFMDFCTESQRYIISKKIIIQGKEISLDELITLEDANSESIIDSKTLVKLIQNEKVTIGRKPQYLYDAVIHEKIHEEILENNLVDKILSSSDKPNLFMLSGINEADTKELLQKLDKIVIVKKNREDLIDGLNELNANDKKIFISVGTDQNVHLINFKRLCRRNPENIINWIHQEITASKTRFVWRYLYNPHFYIERNIKYRETVVLDEKKLKSLDLQLRKGKLQISFLLSGIDYQGLIVILKIPEDQLNEMLSSNFIKIIKSEVEVESIFLKAQSRNESVHWFALQEINNNQKLIWRRSYGSLKFLRYMLDKQYIKNYSEEKFCEEVKDHLVIFADDPGAGKSTTLIRLAKNKLDTSWLFYVKFADFVNAIDALPTKITIKETCKFLLGNERTKLEKRLLTFKLQQQTGSQTYPVVLLFDGFDEIAWKYQKTVIPLLQFLKEKTTATVWITTRRHTQEDLEKELSVFAINFDKFNGSQQERFLEKFWRIRAEFIHNHQNYDEKIKLYAKALCKKATEFFKEKYLFMGLALQLRLLAESYQKKCLTFIKRETNEYPQFADVNVLNLYKYFIDSRYDIYFSEKFQLNENNRTTQNMLIGSFNKHHSYLAFRQLFPENQDWVNKIFSIYKPTEKEMFDIQLVGLVVDYKEFGPLCFIHKTFAEYFVADLFVRCLRMKEHLPVMQKDLLRHLFKKMYIENYEVMRTFIDCKLASDSKLLTAILNCNVTKKLLNENKNDKDILGRTALHFAALVGQIDTVKHLLDLGCEPSKDSFKKSPSYYAHKYGPHREVLKLLKSLK